MNQEMATMPLPACGYVDVGIVIRKVPAQCPVGDDHLCIANLPDF
jgi:hypothetical protein